MKDKENENDIQIKRDSKIKNLEKAMQWFREEALVLGEKNNQNKKDIEKYRAKCENLQDDHVFL